VTKELRPLHPLELEQLELENERIVHEITDAKHQAELSRIELAGRKDMERDRKAKPGFTRKLNFFGDVSEHNVDQVIEALEHWNVRDPGKPITITFNTQGGSVTAGLALYDTIKRLQRAGHFITTRAVGIAASMGAVLFQAGDVRVMDARAKLLIHEGSTDFEKGATLSAGALEDYAVFSKMLDDDVLDILAERSTFTRKQIADKQKRRDWWITAADALKYGFCDEVQ
jgi:ATP-dependent Clp protease protease subunit